MKGRARRAVAGLALLCASPAFAQFQSNFLTPSVQMGGVLGQTQVFAGAVEVEDAGPFDVALTAHVYVEGETNGSAIYEIGICRDDLPGLYLGRTLWFLEDAGTSGLFQGDTVTVTGFDAGVSGPVTYTICARAMTGAAPPVVTLSARGLDAVRAAPGTGLSGVSDTDLVFDSVLVSLDTFASIASVDVSGSTPYDVALTAHVSATRTASAAATQRWVVAICRDSTSGPLVGATLYEPSRGPDVVTDSIAVTGFDPQRTAATTYHLCVRKVDADAPPMTIDLHGFHARTAPAQEGLSGFEQPNSLLATAIPSTASVSLAEVEADAAAPFDVFLTAHAYVEGNALANDAYAIEICRDDENGARVGLAQWLPLDSASPQGTLGDSVTVTGFDPDRTGPTTYVLCGRKIGSTAPTVTVLHRGIVAEAVPEPGAAGVVAGVCLARMARRRRRTGKDLR